MANVLIKIEYDGSQFCGWQKQPAARTVQGEIEHVLEFIAGEPVHIHGTSRTDAGVHALGQCASFEWTNNMPIEKLPEVMNRRLGVGGTGRQGAEGDIKILSAEEKPADFHARYDCKGKTYQYVIDKSTDIFKRNYGYQFPEAADLDLEKMREAAEHIKGTHDFKCFEAAGGTMRETTVRTISALDIADQPEHNSLSGHNPNASGIIISVTGDGFLYNMVRIIVGTLIEVGLGKRDPKSLVATIESKDRANAGFTAPPQGLYLKEIYF